MLFAPLTGWVVARYSYTPVFIGFGLLPMVCVAVLWTVVGGVDGERRPTPGKRESLAI